MKRYEELTIKDDFLFSKVMARPDLCKQMIEIMLNIKVDKIVKVESNYAVAPVLDKHSIRLDVYVKDSNKIYDIEMQTTNEHNLEKRARYYQSIIDIDELDKSVNYKELKESYIIFICTFDPLKRGKLKYDIKQIIYDEEEFLKDKILYFYDDNTNKIFYNLTSKELLEDNSELAKFLRYIRDDKIDGEFSSKVDHAVKQAKYFKPWRKEYMTMQAKIDDAYYDGLKRGERRGITLGKKQGRTEGISIGEQRALQSTAIKLLQSNLDFETVSKCTNISIDKLKELLNKSSK